MFSFFFFFFRTLVFFPSFYLHTLERKKKYRSRAGYAHMFPLPSMDAHQHHHHYRPQGHQSTSDSEEMAFMASQLLDGIFFFFSLLDSLFFFSFFVSLSPRIFIFVQQQNDKTDRESLSSSLCFFRRAEREHAQSLTRGVFAVNAYRERLASRRGGVGDERAAPAPATGSATRTKENDFSQRKGGGGTRRFEEKDEEKEKKERTREGRR
jgi:hypothetical protein